MYLTSPGCPTDIGLQLGSACCPCLAYSWAMPAVLAAGKGREGIF